MILYHGSNTDIQEIDLSQSRPYKDFGQGFYLTQDKEQATRMAEQKTLQLGGIPVVTAYEFDEQHLNDSTVLLWHRTGHQTIEKAMTNDEQFLIDSITTELIALLMDECRYDLETAIDKVYNSDTYTKLTDTHTGLYYQSPLYVYDFLKNELKMNNLF